MPAAHDCPGECEDEDCPCCLGDCSCLGDPQGASRKPLRPIRPLVGEPAVAYALRWERELRARARRLEALRHPADLAPADPAWVKAHGRAAGGVERRLKKGGEDA